ncbi:unnamed protein product [Sphagnum tenellum]
MMTTKGRILLSRDAFREGVFARDGHKCVFCDIPADTVHHIIERRLWGESGGYFLDNGASVCSAHHLQCEMTLIDVDEVRRACNIQKPILPDHLYDDESYDKWGNIILANGMRLRGELFYDESVQKILAQGNVLDLFTNRVKYPRTYHVLWSEGMHDDDRMHPNMDNFVGKRVIVTTKMDGENCLDGGTLINTSDGLITIKDICEKESPISVLSFNGKNEEYREVVGKNVLSESSDWYEIETESGNTLRLTGDHELWVEDTKSYKKCRDLDGTETLRISDDDLCNMQKRF